MGPELTAKPLGFIMLRPHEQAAFDAMTEAQKGYFLHWCRSNPWSGRSWDKMVDRAKEPRP